MKYLVAVSGGVDSVVLLDMMVKKHGTANVVVGHFEHGMRGEDSLADARFVEALCKQSNVECIAGSGKLGQDASEESARQARYDFLLEAAKKLDAKLVTAHHQNDLVETIAVNLHRGTGWRGLAVFGNNSILRPLRSLQKKQLYQYASENNLEWVEDETNQTGQYLRNSLRKKTGSLPKEKIEAIYQLYLVQTECTVAIDTECQRLLNKNIKTNRYFFTMIDTASASELLRALLDGSKQSLTRPRRERLLRAIKLLPPGSTFEAGDGVKVEFTKREFIVKGVA